MRSTKPQKMPQTNQTQLNTSMGKGLCYKATGEFPEPFVVASSEHLLVTFWKQHSFDHIELNNWKAEANNFKIP